MIFRLICLSLRPYQISKGISVLVENYGMLHKNYVQQHSQQPRALRTQQRIIPITKSTKSMMLRMNHQARTHLHTNCSHLHSEISLHWSWSLIPPAPHKSPTPKEPPTCWFITSRPRDSPSFASPRSSSKSRLFRKDECSKIELEIFTKIIESIHIKLLLIKHIVPCILLLYHLLNFFHLVIHGRQ